MYLKTKWKALREDLRKHLTVGGMTALVVTMLAARVLPIWVESMDQHWVLGLVAAPLLGFVAGERAGWAKEYLVDAAGYGHVDRDDYLFTARGAVAGSAIGLLIALCLLLG